MTEILQRITPFIILFGAFYRLYRHIWAKKMSIQGDRHLLKKPHEGPPGAVRYKVQQPTGEHSTILYDHFVVSVDAAALPVFYVRFSGCTKLTRSRLDQYSDALFETIFNSFTGAVDLPAAWGRNEKTTLLAAVTAIPIQNGTLESRNGRLVLHWYCITQPPSRFTPTPEQLLDTTQTTMAGLPRALAG